MLSLPYRVIVIARIRSMAANVQNSAISKFQVPQRLGTPNNQLQWLSAHVHRTMSLALTIQSSSGR